MKDKIQLIIYIIISFTHSLKFNHLFYSLETVEYIDKSKSIS